MRRKALKKLVLRTRFFNALQRILVRYFSISKITSCLSSVENSCFESDLNTVSRRICNRHGDKYFDGYVEESPVAWKKIVKSTCTKHHEYITEITLKTTTINQLIKKKIASKVLLTFPTSFKILFHIAVFFFTGAGGSVKSSIPIGNPLGRGDVSFKSIGISKVRENAYTISAVQINVKDLL